MLYQAMAVIVGAFLVLFVLMPANRTSHFDFMDALLLFAGLGSLMYGVLTLTSILPR
jgi:hypothetical protein